MASKSKTYINSLERKLSQTQRIFADFAVRRLMIIAIDPQLQHNRHTLRIIYIMATPNERIIICHKDIRV